MEYELPTFCGPLHAVPLALLVVADDLVLCANPAAATLFREPSPGLEPEQVADLLSGLELRRERSFGEQATGTNPLTETDGRQRPARLAIGDRPWRDVLVTATGTVWYGHPAILLACVPDPAPTIATNQPELTRDLAMYQQVLQISEDGYYLIDVESMTYLDVNEAAARSMECTREEVMAMGPLNAARQVGRDVDWVRSVYQGLIEQSPRPHITIEKVVGLKGRHWLARITRQAFRAADRWLVVLVIRDITQEQQAKARTERFAAVTDLSPDAIVLTDCETARFIDVNEGACRMFGYSREELIALEPHRVATRYASEAHLRAMFERVIAMHPRPMREEMTGVHRDGQHFPVEITRQAMQSEGRWVLGVTIRDLSERYRAQHDLALFRAALDLSTEAIVLIDRSTQRFIDANQTACRLYGLAREALLASAPHEVGVRRAGADEQAAEFDAVIAQHPHPVVTQEFLQRPDGTQVPAQTTRRALCQDGRWLIVVTSRDLSERHAIMQRNEMLVSLTNLSANAQFVVDHDSMSYLYANDAACRMMGRPLDDVLIADPRLPPWGGADGSTLAEEYAAAICRSPEPLVRVHHGGSGRAGGMTWLELSLRALRLHGRWLVTVQARDVTQREAARRHLELFRAAMDQATDAVMLIHPIELRYIDVSEAACRLIGASREQLLAAGPVVAVQLIKARLEAFRASGPLVRLEDLPTPPASAADEVRARFVSVLESPRRRTETFEDVVRPDGSLGQYEIARVAVRVNDEDLIVFTARDVSQQRAARRREQTLARLMNLSGDGLFVVDYTHRKVIYANDSGCDFLHRPMEAVLAQDPLEPSGPYRTRAEVQAEFEQLIANSPSQSLKVHGFTRSDGVAVWLEIVRQAACIDETWYITTLIRDVTGARLAQARNERLAAIVNLSVDGMSVIDMETARCVEANDAAARILGTRREHLLSLPPWRIGAGDQDEISMRAMFARVRASAPAPLIEETEERRPSGSRLFLETQRQAVQVNGRWLMLVSLRDVTARKLAEIELRRRMADLARSNDELAQFAYVASHDLSEPLRMVASYTQLLQRRYQDRLDDDGREFMGFVIDGAARMKQLIDDLLAYSRAGRSGEPRELAIAGVIDEAKANLAALCAEREARFEIGPMPTLNGDRRSFVQVLQNLIGNALKFSPQRPAVVRIEATQSAEGWEFAVTDEGIGIDERYFQRIFEIFERLHGRADYPGTGIGLAICKRIVEGWGGRIWVESRPGQGSTFRFTVPVLPGPGPE